MSIKNNNLNILQLFEQNKIVKICAPMVRYSKLQFRTLVRNYNCDLCYTPMILADAFCQSAKARNNEFTTNLSDTPVVAQFASNNINDFVCATKLISPYCDGVDLNCGCPQRWAKKIGLGCIMLENPELIADLIQQCRNQIPKPFTVSMKIRIMKDLKKTIELCRQVEHCGISYISVHGRTSAQLTGKINVEALKLIRENLNCPVVANGGVKTLNDCKELQRETKCEGVMVANGLLTNPTLFSGTTETPVECVQKWVDICFNSTLKSQHYDRPYDPLISEKPPNLTFQCFHHHLVFMLEKILPRSERRVFNNLQTFEDVLWFLRDQFGVVPGLFSEADFKTNRVLTLQYDDTPCENGYVENSYDYESSHGKYFQRRKANKDTDEELQLDLNQVFMEV